MKYLESQKERVGGELTIKGTRIRVAQAITMLANGYTIEQLHEWWPHVPVKFIRGAVEEATQHLTNSANA
jgi:uncharacterized protein (DUF433 family)